MKYNCDYFKKDLSGKIASLVFYNSETAICISCAILETELICRIVLGYSGVCKKESKGRILGTFCWDNLL